ncbi:MAG: hypothetical protein KKD31_11820 [Bacteroidetes bacterium]|nr:hypothetical protein [Bacteroidota bacterium]
MEKQLKNARIQRNILVVLFLAASTLAVIFYSKKAERETVIETMVVEKEVVNKEKAALLVKLEKLQTDYDTLSNHYTELDSLFMAEQENVTALLKKVKKQKGDVSKYKKTVANLETRMSELLQQIEELKEKNEALTAENIRISTALDSTIYEAEILKTDKAILESKLIEGSVMKAYDLVADAIRIKSDGQELPVTKSKKIEKLRTCFILSENPLVAKGKKTIYIRISQPDGKVLTTANKTFTYRNEILQYTTAKQVNYEGKSINLCLYWDKTNDLPVGIYTVDVFFEDELIGTAAFEVE